MISLSQPLAHINAKFILDGSTYTVSKFKVNFAQPVDYKGQPEHEVRGGHLLITLSQAADNNLYLWAKKSTLLKSGQVIFQTDLGISILRVNFADAYCVNLERTTSALTGTETTLIISPKSILMNDVEHSNHWKNG